jgi:Tfp pilus assembly protein PilN
MKRLLFVISLVLASAVTATASSTPYAYLEIRQRHQRYLDEEQKKKDIVDAALRKRQFDERLAEIARVDQQEQKRRQAARQKKRHIVHPVPATE